MENVWIVADSTERAGGEAVFGRMGSFTRPTVAATETPRPWLFCFLQCVSSAAAECSLPAQSLTVGFAVRQGKLRNR